MPAPSLTDPPRDLTTTSRLPTAYKYHPQAADLTSRHQKHTSEAFNSLHKTRVTPAGLNPQYTPTNPSTPHHPTPITPPFTRATQQARRTLYPPLPPYPFAPARASRRHPSPFPAFPIPPAPSLPPTTITSSLPHAVSFGKLSGCLNSRVPFLPLERSPDDDAAVCLPSPSRGALDSGYVAALLVSRCEETRPMAV